MLKKILVTGGVGFIGSHVVDTLTAEMYRPVIFDRRRDRATFLGSILDPTDVTEALGHVDGFIHLAGILGTQETIQNPRPALETNIMGSINVLEAAAQYKVPGVVIGIGNHFMNNTYSISKSTVERLVAMYNAERGTKINIVRPMNAYGPRQVASAPYGPSKVRKIAPSLICRALRGDPLELYGGGHQVSDMVYVEDVAKALVNALKYAMAGVVFNKVVEVGPEEHLTVREIAHTILDITESTSPIVDLPMRPGEKAGAHVFADTSTLDLVGMSPETLVPIYAGMKRAVDYYRGQM
jgi:nucleoside-diphosphate-sugar epimerase